jgi:hypothetical protein
LKRGFSAPQWSGAAAPGKTILVHAEQGIGDTIQFLRYVPFVLERACVSRVIFECSPELLRLFNQNNIRNVEIVARQHWEAAASLPFDCHVPLLSLPLALEMFEPHSEVKPYLHAEEDLCATWRQRLGQNRVLRVGLAWAGNPMHRHDHRRTIYFEKLLPILRVPDVSFYNLQIGMPHTLSMQFVASGLLDLTEGICDFADTAALIAELDLVITVDTAVAHLAGALGRPVWTLLPFMPDWRWGLKREDTPWYSTMRLFRQPKAGDWESVIARVAGELHALSVNRTFCA